jgi:hypothetical protein
MSVQPISQQSTFAVILSKPKGDQSCHLVTCIVMNRVLWAFNSDTIGLVCNRKSGTTFTVLKMGPNCWASEDHFVLEYIQSLLSYCVSALIAISVR